MCVLDREGRFLRINPELAAMNVIPSADHHGKTVREVVPDLAGLVETFVGRVFETNRGERVELRGTTPLDRASSVSGTNTDFPSRVRTGRPRPWPWPSWCRKSPIGSNWKRRYERRTGGKTISRPSSPTYSGTHSRRSGTASGVEARRRERYLLATRLTGRSKQPVPSSTMPVTRWRSQYRRAPSSSMPTLRGCRRCS
jgi:hypothetical protein